MLTSGQIIFNHPSELIGKRGNSKPQKNSTKTPAQEKAPSNQGNKNQKPSNQEQLEGLIEKYRTVLYKLSSVFPFDLFPDEITVTENRVNIINREFFGSEQIYNILIKDIADVNIETNPFFATIKMYDARRRERPPLKVSFLKKEDALEARTIIQGLISGTAQGIDFSKFDPEELVKKIKELSKASEIVK